MALVVVRHAVGRSVGDATEFLSRLAASGGTMLVRVRISDGIERAHPVLIDERRPLLDGRRAWWSSWSDRIGIPAAAGTLTIRTQQSGRAVLDFSGACTSQRGVALARAYLETLAESIEAAAA